MHRLSSIASDPLSQLQQFNWSPNFLASTESTQPPNTAGSSALQRSLSPAARQPVALSPIGSHFPSQAGHSARPLPRPLQVGGSAQLLQSSQSSVAPASSAPGTDSHNDKAHSLDIPREVVRAAPQERPLAQPVPQLNSQHFFRSSPPSFMQRPSPPSEVNSPLNTTPSTTGGSDHQRRDTASVVPNPPQTVGTAQQQHNAPLPRSSTTLWMGDLESWMDEDYVRRCVVMMGWNLPHYFPRRASGAPSGPDLGSNGVNVKIKMVSGASPSSAYCFLTYPDPDMAEHAWRMISNMPPTLMPGCERTFKLNWATGLPGVQPTWDREFSVFIRDLDREVTEGELVALFTCSFPSTKSAKIMGDLSTGLSRGYAFIRFGEESDMHRALALGRSKNGTGMFLRGRCIKISEASGSSGTAGDHAHHRASASGPHHQASQNFRSRQPSGILSSNQPSEQVDNRLKALPTEHGASRAHSTPTNADTGLAGRRISRDGLAQNMGSASASCAAPRIGSNCTSRPSLHNLFQPQQVPLTSAPLSRANSACQLPLDHSSSIPVQMYNGTQAYPMSRPLCAVPPQGMAHPSQLPFGTSNIIQPTRPSLSPPAMPLGPSPGPQLNRFTPIVHTPPIFTTFLPTPPHTSFSSATYPRPAELFPPTAATTSPNFSPYYSQFNSRFEGYVTAPGPAGTPNTTAAHFAALAQIAAAANQASNDPSNTTVFVGGLPACISEETLKAFFLNFGEITYVKIPPNKGCGFVQYVRRADAEQAMIKMHDFPIHGKSRIRLSWGRSLGDKQVEYVKKLSSYLGISFESVWKIVQGQDHSTIKQIASAVGGAAHPNGIGSAPPALPAHTGLDQTHQPHTVTDQITGFIPQARCMAEQTRTADPRIPGSGLGLPTRLNSLPGSLHSTSPLYPTHESTTDNGDDLSRIRTSRAESHPMLASSGILEPLSTTPGQFSTSPPTTGLRSLRHESSLHGGFQHVFENCPSSLSRPDLSEVIVNRRATIHPPTPASFQSDHVPSFERYRSGSLGSSGQLGADGNHLESLEAKWAGLCLNPKRPVVNGGRSIKLESDDLNSRLLMLGRGRGGLLGGLMEEEEEREGDTNPPRLHRAQTEHRMRRSDSGVTSPTSLSNSSQILNHGFGSGGLSKDRRSLGNALDTTATDLSCPGSRGSLRDPCDKRGLNLISLSDGLSRNDSALRGPWDRPLGAGVGEAEKDGIGLRKLMVSGNGIRSSGNAQADQPKQQLEQQREQPFGFESLEKYWKLPI